MTLCKKCKAMISAPISMALANGGFANPKRVSVESIKAEMCKECFDKGTLNQNGRG